MHRPSLIDQRVSKLLPAARSIAGRFASPNYDAYAECCLTLVMVARRYPEDGEKFPQYAFSAMRNRMITLLRKHRNAPRTVDWQEVESSTSQGELGEPLPDYGCLIAALRGSDTSQLRAERRELIAAILKGLTRSEKRLLLLLLRGQSQRQIGKALGVSQTTVFWRVKALAAKVRESLGEYNGSR